MSNNTKCPGCGGEPDNGFDRYLPPNPYYCSGCEESRKNGADGFDGVEYFRCVTI